MPHRKPIRIFKLKKDINSPQFTEIIQAGRIFAESRLRQYFPHIIGSEYLSEWFDDVSDQYEIINCRLVQKLKA